MRRIIFLASILALASLFSGCEPAASNNTANKAANAANNSNAAKPVDTAAIETEIKRRVADAAATMTNNDAAGLEKMTIDSYKFINPNGQLSTRAERVASLRSGESKYESVAYDEVTVNLNPSASGAIVIARATVKGVNMGNKVDGQYRVTQIWRKTDDGWKMAHGQATAIAASASTAASNSASASNTAANSSSNR
jgi:ketosteroid isomerase-like protein